MKEGKDVESSTMSAHREGVKPVILWAVFGLIATCFSLSIFGQWIFSPAFAPVPLTAEDAMPSSGILVIRIFEAISVLVLLIIFYYFLYRPWKRTGRAPFTGLMLFGALLSYVLDVTVDYHGYWMAWNRHSLNMGVWSSFFPGHTGPTQYAEGIVWGMPMYCYFGVLLGSLQLKVIEVIRRRLNASLFVATLASMVFAFLFDLAAEWTIISVTQAYGWGLTTRAFTLAAGSQYQFPLYECLAVAFFGTIYAFILKSEREKGSVFAERGLERLPLGIRHAARLFAAIGLAFIPTIVYFGTFNLFSIGANSYAALPHYLTYIK